MTATNKQTNIVSNIQGSMCIHFILGDICVFPKMLYSCWNACADPESFVIDNVFINDEGREDPNTIISGSISARQRFAGGPMMAQY